MNMKKSTLPVFLAFIWIAASEFARNELLLKSYWTNHYQGLGLVFPSETVNGLVWGVWSLVFAILIFAVSRKFSLTQTILISWFAGFVLMGLAIWNLGVLPVGILLFALPWSLLETGVASFFVHLMNRRKK